MFATKTGDLNFPPEKAAIFSKTMPTQILHSPDQYLSKPESSGKVNPSSENTWGIYEMVIVYSKQKVSHYQPQKPTFTRAGS